MTRYRDWLFVIPNFTQKELQYVRAFLSTCKYGFLHQQKGDNALRGMLCAASVKSQDQICAIIGNPLRIEARPKEKHIKPKQYSLLANSEDNEFFEEFGTVPAQGTRNDLLEKNIICNNAVSLPEQAAPDNSSSSAISDSIFQHIVTENEGLRDIIKTMVGYQNDHIQQLIATRGPSSVSATTNVAATSNSLVTNDFAVNSNNNTINSNNNFNLQFFLNETCKNAMNIDEFVDSIKIELSDLINIGKVGYVQGISDVIISNLNKLDITERPIHCTDKKRETIYVKKPEQWQKDDERKTCVRNVIRKVLTKNRSMLPSYREAHPDCNRSSSRFADQYNLIIVEVMVTETDPKDDKIIRNLCKSTTIDRNDHSIVS